MSTTPDNELMDANKPSIFHRPDIIRFGTMEQTETIGKLALALSRFQAEFVQPSKDKTARVRMKSGGEYTYNYCDLATIIKAAAPLLGKHELAVHQSISTGQGFVRVVTTLMHSSGQWIRDTLTLPVLEDTPQSYGSAMTYARRYGYCAPLGISADDDDDAQAAQDVGKGASTGRRTTTAQSRPSPAQEKTSDTAKKTTNQQKPKPTSVVAQAIEKAYAPLGVSRAMLEKRMGKPLDTIVEEEVDLLRNLKLDLDSGKASIAEVFGISDNAVAALNGQFT